MRLGDRNLLLFLGNTFSITNCHQILFKISDKIAEPCTTCMGHTGISYLSSNIYVHSY